VQRCLIFQPWLANLKAVPQFHCGRLKSTALLCSSKIDVTPTDQFVESDATTITALIIFESCRLKK
jgi:hypothetical protein